MINKLNEFELPYEIIDLSCDGITFSVNFLSFDEDQTPESISRGGLTGSFGIAFREKGLSAEMPCMLTIGNAYDFYDQLKRSYDTLSGTAVLQDYGGRDTCIEIFFEKTGKCKVSGKVKNKSHGASGGIDFEFESDQSYFAYTVTHLEHFFKELAKLQGHDEFY